MGNSKSTKQDLQENGVVNSNFIVQQAEYNVTKDVKIILYLILAIMILYMIAKLFKAYRRNIKKQIRRNLGATTANLGTSTAIGASVATVNEV